MDKKNNTAAQEDGAEFIPQAHAVRFNDEEITVAPLNVMQVIQVSRAMKAVLPALDRVQALLGTGDGAMPELGTDEIAIVVELLADYGEPLTEGIALCIGKPVDFVRGANDFAGLFALIAAIVRVNVDFFGQQAGPHLAGLLGAAAQPGHGPTPSTPSSAPATT